MKLRLAALAVLAVAPTARAEPIRFTVTEISGDIAFVDAGETSGLVPGMVVGDTGFVVVEVNAKTAAIRLGGKPVAIGATLTATREPPPRALQLTDNTGQWPDVVPPARKQTPRSVELATDEQRVRLAVIGHAFGTAGQGGTHLEGEVRVLGSFELLADRPLGADLDASARFYAKGYDAVRVPLLVHNASLRYGDRRDPAVAIGRLHFAASTLGPLDGGRAAVHAGKLELAAFGGLVPDPINGRPDTSAARFGGELVYDDAQAELRPRLSIVVHGSTWDGELDERRLNVAGSVVHGGTWLNAWAEAQQFAADNPFGAKAVELVGAGASTEWRRRDAHVGADVTYLLPERSLRIAALIPAWLCTRVPQPTVGASEACRGDDRLIASTVSAGVRGATWALDGAASIAHTQESESGLGGSGYLRGEYRAGIASVHLTGSGGRVGFADWISAEAGVGVAPSRRFDAQVSYRPERLDERAGDPTLIHAIVADGRYGIAQSVDLGVFLLGAMGSGRDFVAALTTIAWRP